MCERCSSFFVSVYSWLSISLVIICVYARLNVCRFLSFHIPLYVSTCSCSSILPSHSSAESVRRLAASICMYDTTHIGMCMYVCIYACMNVQASRPHKREKPTMGGQGWLFQVWLCWLGGYGGWVHGCWGVLRTHGSFRVTGQLQWSPWPKWRLIGRARSLRPHSGYSTPIRPARSLGRSYRASSPASGGDSPGSSFDTGTMCWTFSGSTQGHSRYGSKDGSCWKPLGDSTSSPRPWSTISSSVWLWYKRYIAAWFPASMFLIEGLYSLLGSGLNLTWTGSIRRTLRGAYRLCRSMLVISADLMHQALWVFLLSAAVLPAESCLRCIIGGCTVFTVARLLLQATRPHDTRLGDWPLMCPPHGQFRHTLTAVTW